jgi:hypothetical protein
MTSPPAVLVHQHFLPVRHGIKTTRAGSSPPLPSKSAFPPGNLFSASGRPSPSLTWPGSRPREPTSDSSKVACPGIIGGRLPLFAVPRHEACLWSTSVGRHARY